MFQKYLENVMKRKDKKIKNIPEKQKEYFGKKYFICED